MATAKVHRDSQEKLEFPVMAREDPTVLPVHWTFTETTVKDTPGTMGWIVGEWQETPGSQAGDTWTGVALSPVVGAGSLDLDPGKYSVYVKVTASPEIPVIPAGRVQVL